MRTIIATTVFKMPLYGICCRCPHVRHPAVFRNAEKLFCANEVSTSNYYLDNRCSLISEQNVSDLISLPLQLSVHADLLSFYAAKSATGLSRCFCV